MSETKELADKLAHRQALNDGDSAAISTQRDIFNPYTEFKEFSRKEIKNLEKTFKKYDADKNNHLDLMECKIMMEKIGAPQTHLGLKGMISEVDEDLDNMISFREFLLIFRKARAGELTSSACESLYEVYKDMVEVDVDAEGVKGAKNFFQAKIQNQTESNKFEQEILAEQEERKRAQEEAKERKRQFREKANVFKQS